jgi:formylglycine-generating enzyme
VLNQRLALGCCATLGLFGLFSASPKPVPAEPAPARVCPRDMVIVRSFCVDRFEMSTVDNRTGKALSPFYPPHPKLLESALGSWTVERVRVGIPGARDVSLPLLPEIQYSRTDYVPRAISRPGVVPQGYIPQWLAKVACANAGKRLCTEEEWVEACRGSAIRKFPYGARFEDGSCNVYRHLHPAALLHAASFYGHLDPRLNLVSEANRDPLLRLTGATASCRSAWGDDAAFDMVGNLDEWVDDPKGVFVGGFYARSTREGCESRVGVHPTTYYDYSTGARCCKSQ